MPGFNRRNFLKTAGLSALPIVIPGAASLAANGKGYTPAGTEPLVKLFGDGEMFDAAGYINELQKINAAKLIEPDRYGVGGAVADLEKKFEEITGKEKAIFMPTGTMANQLAIAVLSGENAKVIVQETSHVFRDEADAAQTVFGKRLIPLAKEATYFTAAELQQAVEYHKANEAFKSEVGCISIENPVRRMDGRAMPADEIKKVSAWCRSNNIKMHLDGARIYMASAWSGVPVKEYAGYFDTIYISLYKYLGASAGAMLCGPKDIIGKMEHLMKIHGGTMFRNWTNAAMALHRLEGMESRLQNAKAMSAEIFAALNRVSGIKISALEGGTNIYSLVLDKKIDGKLFTQNLNTKYGIRMPFPDARNESRISVNETLLYKDSAAIIGAFKNALKDAGG
jgi:threonine aldolase